MGLTTPARQRRWREFCLCGQGKPNQSEERECVNNGWDQNGKGLGMAQIARYGVKWLLLAAAAGVLAGTTSALFLALLEWATATREGAPWLLWLLPAAGALISYMYATVGGEAGQGNNLLIERIHEGRGTVPLRMAPLVLIGTVATHLFGGSAGREGTAVQMGGSLAAYAAGLLRIRPEDRPLLLMCGVAAGFGSVFGTPLAGAVFAAEMLTVGTIRYRALFPCFAAALIGDAVTTAWGIDHPHYDMGGMPEFSILLLLRVALAAALFGLVSAFFSELVRTSKAVFARLASNPAVRSAAGGTLVIALVYIAGTRDYLGLSLPLLSDAFAGESDPFAFLWKTVFTAVTLGSGFQGGEVTPLFVIGATFGEMMSGPLSLSASFLAGLGLVGVFCGATNTPVACLLLGIELFGFDNVGYIAVVCVISYLASGHTGIYSSQRITASKLGRRRLPEGTTIGTARRRKQRS